MKNKLFISIVAILAAFAAFLSFELGAVEVVTASSVFVSTDPDRAVYDRLDSFLKSKFGALSYVITPNDLRLEQVLSPSNNNYSFDPYEGNSNQDRPLEKRLSRNDLFVATHIAVNITKQNAVVTPKEYANFPLFTWPDPVIFDGDGEAKSLETVFQGKINMQTASMVRFQNFLTHNCRFVPERISAIAGEAPDTYTVYGEYGPDNDHRGYYRLNPNMLIDGTEDNKFQLSLGAGDHSAIDGAGEGIDTRNVLVLLVKGFSISGVAFEEWSQAKNRNEITFA